MPPGGGGTATKGNEGPMDPIRGLLPSPRIRVATTPHHASSVTAEMPSGPRSTRAAFIGAVILLRLIRLVAPSDA